MKTEDILAILGKGRLLENEPMKAHTTMRAGGPARFYAVPYDEEELRQLILFLREENYPYFVTGNGSNLLVSDRGYDGMIVNLGRNDEMCFTGIRTEETEEGFLLRAGAGCLMSSAGKYCLQEELAGFEPLSGIPGCVGGGVIMNAGAYGGEVKDLLVSVRAVSPRGELRTFQKEEISLRYRGSSLYDDGMIVTEASFLLRKGDPSDIKALMDDLSERRRSKQPLEFPSAGSTFQRPEGYFAGKLIEDAGLKGVSEGGASVSEKHAGFVINRGGSAEDVYRLIRHIQKKVFETSGVELETEVRMLGDFSYIS